MNGALLLPIPVTSMVNYTHAMGGNEQDMDKVKLIERKMLPWLQEKSGSNHNPSSTKS